MRVGVHGDDVRIWSCRLEGYAGDARLVVAEHGQRTVLRRDIHQVQCWIGGQHIRTLPDLLGRDDLPGRHIEHNQLVVALASGECTLLVRIDQEAVRVVAAGRVVPFDDLIGGWIDGDYLIVLWTAT